MIGSERDRISQDEEIDPRETMKEMLTDCRGYYGQAFGSGLSPYTDFWPDYPTRIRPSESPYTKLGPVIWPKPRKFGHGESPYTRYSPNYSGRQSSGESPYTDFGPTPC